MSNDKPLHCGGMVDGEECEGAEWEPEHKWWKLYDTPHKPQLAAKRIVAFADKLSGARHCLHCGVLCGVDANGNPIEGLDVIEPLVTTCKSSFSGSTTTL